MYWFIFINRLEYVFQGPWGRGGVLPYKRLMGMCRWMGSYFHDWIDYNGVAFSIEFLEWSRTCNCAVLSCGPTFTNMQKNMLLSVVIVWSAVYTFSRFFKHVYVVVNFYLRGFLFFLCFNFISKHYHTQKQKKIKNYLRCKINCNRYN